MEDSMWFFLGIVVGIVVSWLYRYMRKSQKEKQEEEEAKQNFGVNYAPCTSKCSRNELMWDKMKEECDKYNGKWQKCGDKDFFGRQGRKCSNYDAQIRDNQGYCTIATGVKVGSIVV